MEPPQDFQSLQEGIQKSLVSTVKTVNRIAAQDLPFQRAANPDVAEQLDEGITRALNLSSRLLESAAKACGVDSLTFEDVEDVDIKWRSVVDVVDSVLEKADMALDECTGLIKRKEPPVADTVHSSAPGHPIFAARRRLNHAYKTHSSKRARPTAKVIRNANVSKPQALFERKPDNFPSGPWKPILTAKPHATTPLNLSLIIAADETNTPQYTGPPRPRLQPYEQRSPMLLSRYKHPYETEIKHMKYPKRLFQTAEPIPPQPAETTAAVWVDTYDGVLDMLKELEKAKEIAVDLEHHDFRTYTGLVCLMQVSTRDKDWIVDTLQPWRHRLEVLNNVFANPKIVKVCLIPCPKASVLIHPRSSTAPIWTWYGCSVISVSTSTDSSTPTLPATSSPFLARAWHFCYPNMLTLTQISSTNSLTGECGKMARAWSSCQGANVAGRPIPEEMMYYARSDTHYLLYIYDCLRNELVAASDRSDPETDYISMALERSRELALSRHEHADCDEETGAGVRGWYNFLLKQSHLGLDGEQFAIFRALWKWRDTLARQEDESPNFVLGTSSVMGIVRINPPDIKALHSLLPVTAPMARSRFKEVWSLVQEARARGGPTALQFYSSDCSSSMGKSWLAAKPAQMLTVDGEIAVRSLPRSQLFGDMAVSTLWEPGRVSQVKDGLVAFPWQRFVHDASAQAQPEQGNSAAESAGVAAPAEESTAAELMVEDIDEEFTLKKGRRRRSAAAEGATTKTPGDSGEDTAAGAMAEDDVPEPRRGKPEKHRNAGERKTKKGADGEARRAKRQQEKAQEEQQELTTEAEEAFDYSKAASVLHAKQDTSVPARQPKKMFDPYSKTGDDALKGARKAPPVRGERSATFKK